MPKEKLTIATPTGDTEKCPCSSCNRNTAQTVLTRVATADETHDGEARILFWNEYLTTKCNGCGTIGFCHVSMNSENEDYDDSGHPFPAKQKVGYPTATEAQGPVPEGFVNLARLAAIESLPKVPHDTTKLIQMLRELNRAYAGHAYLSCSFLIRAILDHIPPILGFRTFTEAANNYSAAGQGAKSLRASMQHLENASRKIADAHLHVPIRAVEAIPNSAQVEFRADLDVLLAELDRVLRPTP